MIVRCAQCGQEIIRRPSELAKSKSGRSFCSKDCALKFNKVSVVDRMKALSDDELRKLVKSVTSFTKLARLLGTNSKGYSQPIREELDRRSISYTHFNSGRSENFSTVVEDYGKLFCKDSPHSNRTVKDKILKEKLIEYKCSYCGNTGEWNNKPLALHLHHKSGDNTDNRLSNLEFVCPNCHSQTDTYTGRNRIIVRRLD